MSLDKNQYNEDDFPHLKEWMAKMSAREVVKAVFDDQMAASK